MEKLLLEDLKHFADSLWRNEEVGEKRFNFFVTLITAVAAGIVSLHTAEKVAGYVDRELVTQWAISGLLAVGAMTYLRMLQRIRIKKEIIRTLKYLRRSLVALQAGRVGYHVPRKPGMAPQHDPNEPDDPPDDGRVHWRKAPEVLITGGFGVLVGLIDGLLLGILTYTLSLDVCRSAIVAVCGLVVFLFGVAYEECRS